MPFTARVLTQNSGIDIGQEINVGPGKFGKNNKRRALNNSRPWKIWQNFKISIESPRPPQKNNFRFFILNLINVGPFDKAVGHGKKFKINKCRTGV